VSVTAHAPAKAATIAKRQALLALIRDLLARDIQLHGVRLLGHNQGKHQID
jgi:hypothetical protein